MSDYLPPPADAVVLVFKAAPYSPPPAVVDLVFGAEASDGTDAGLLQANFLILLTM